MDEVDVSLAQDYSGVDVSLAQVYDLTKRRQ